MTEAELLKQMNRMSEMTQEELAEWLRQPPEGWISRRPRLKGEPPDETHK